MKNLWIVANWKSNKSIAEALDWLNIVGSELPKQENLKIVVCPTFSCLSEIKKEIQVNNYSIILGSQNLSPFGIGAFTGEESAELLKEFVDFSIIGHSERRENFGEIDAVLAEKVKLASGAGIESIFCIQGINTPIPPEVKIVAYEPVFAIGTGTPDTPESAQNVASQVKAKSSEMNVLYGGSVTAENCAFFIKQDDISGLLIGKASLNPQEFLKIIENCGRV